MTLAKQNSLKKPVAWTIAGSDSGGGAGIQADLHTFQDFSVHACSVVTAVTAQNSIAIPDSLNLNKDTVAAQINTLAIDMPAAVIKIGMLAEQETVAVVADYLEHYTGFVVYDPVMMASSDGKTLLNAAAIKLMKERLLINVDLLTPNVPEAMTLTGINIATPEDVIKAAQLLLKLGPAAVLLTGGHLSPVDGRRLDYWTDGKQSFWLAAESINTTNSHGSGCTLSSAIAAMIAHGYALADALVVAKAYVTQGIRHGVKIGQGAGPVAHHGWPEQLPDFPILTPQIPPSNCPHFPDCAGPLALYPVVDSVTWIAKLIPLGVTTIQLRIKDASEELLRRQITSAIALCKPNNIRLFINDYWQLAIELGAYGVHLGQEDIESADLDAIAQAGLRLGISTHSYYEIARAHGLNPSYIAIGPVYSTKTKVMKFTELGLGQLQQWVDLLAAHYPLTAIGGISVQRATDVLSTGIGSCAMVTAITEADDYTSVVNNLVAMFKFRA